MMGENILTEKTENLIAIGAAMAANCIPCFEHLYEKAITSGITEVEIKRAAEIASLVKNGAHKAISSIVEEMTGPSEICGSAFSKTGTGCSC